MLHIIKSIADPLVDLIKDDPVRPEIPAEMRVTQNREILTLIDENLKPIAVVCVAFCDEVPTTVDELLKESANPTVATFYTIWSYGTGGGRKLIREARRYIENNYTNIDRFVTLSPVTDMARRFHTSNGAIVLKENDSTVNYEYK